MWGCHHFLNPHSRHSLIRESIQLLASSAGYIEGEASVRRLD
jgi:hypothetical protein